MRTDLNAVAISDQNQHASPSEAFRTRLVVRQWEPRRGRFRAPGPSLPPAIAVSNSDPALGSLRSDSCHRGTALDGSLNPSLGGSVRGEGAVVAPLRYVGVPPASRLVRAVLKIWILVSNVRATAIAAGS